MKVMFILCFIILSADRVHIQDNGTLIIADVRVKDADQYECHAENRAGSIMQTTLLRVNCKFAQSIKSLEDLKNRLKIYILKCLKFF